MEFPTIHKVMKEGRRIELMDGTEEDRADGGRPRYRRLYTEDRYSITFSICFLSAADVQGVYQFYRSYRAEQIEWTDPRSQVTYDVYMTRPPQEVGDVVGMNSIMEIYMEGTPQ